MEKEIEEKIIENIFSHRAFIEGKCMECDASFSRFTNSKKPTIKDGCCSDECAKKVNSNRRKRNKERHHYEVFRDDKFYYIKQNEVLNEKRTYSGKTWTLKENTKLKIPENAIKIIDKVSAYLYTDEHRFDDWKKLDEIK